MKLTVKLLSVLMLAVLLISGCATASQSPSGLVIEETEADAVAHATPKGTGWMISISGVREDEIWESNFEKWKEMEGSEYGEYMFQLKGEDTSFMAIPFKNIIAMVDDPDATMPYAFDAELWKSGYQITLTASDGYSATINTADFAVEDLYIADAMRGEKVAPMLTGNISTQFWVKELASIKADLKPVSLAENNFELILDIGGNHAVRTIAELEKLPYYIEDKGNYTNSYDNNFQYIWGGVKIVDLIEEYASLTPEMTVVIEAMDGYAMSYSASQLLDNSDGDWILAFKENGEYMPEDPGYIRLVKVGPNNPNITGHVSARMVKKIIIKDVAFKDFSLDLTQNGKTEVMDRQTLQSGVTTSRTKVAYFNRKAGEAVEYLGIPVYVLLERYTGYKTVTVQAADGYSITLDAAELAGNDDVIIAMFYGDESELSESEFPLVIVWDQDAALVPAGIKAVRNISALILE